MLVGDRAGIQLLFLSNFTPWRAQGAQLFLKKTTTKPLHPRSIPSRTTLQPLEKRSIHCWHQQGGAVSGINHCAPSPPTTLHPPHPAPSLPGTACRLAAPPPFPQRQQKPAQNIWMENTPLAQRASKEDAAAAGILPSGYREVTRGVSEMPNPADASKTPFAATVSPGLFPIRGRTRSKQLRPWRFYPTCDNGRKYQGWPGWGFIWLLHCCRAFSMR